METTPTRAEAISALQSVVSALAYRLTRRRLHEQLAAAAGVPIDRPGLAVLRVLAEESAPLRLGEIAARLDVRHPHVTRQVRQLAEQGLLARAGGDDRRVQMVELTRRGLDTLTRVTAATEAKLAEGLADVEVEKIVATAEVLMRLGVGWGPESGTGESTPRR
ncbi:hypothetical protein GCM10018793_60680 [Streptomyces sulfonofaciens]|uniref:HTH marR-type domain-containing protein n=1 Tax=Streptomyces sulfonofaciens TaxID=68272 RepID=A0A919GN00_9ACTN|nr:MarR family transcriptional regulator [Streptomyces sulfonofaciens]GHH86911.1 hypothetical protein GCM10018793_60680 [Streptomyces sulfonofaciens]